MGKNLTRIIEREFPGKSPNFAYEKIAAATGASTSSIKRIVAGEIGTTIDTLSNIAYCLGCDVAELTRVPPAEPVVAQRSTELRTVEREKLTRP